VHLELVANSASFGRSKTAGGGFFCAALLLSNGLAPSASAAPDPDTNKNAILLDLDCGGHSVVAAGILQSHSPSFLVVSSESPAIRAGSVGTTFGYDAWDNPERSGDPVASFRQPGFFGANTNGQELTACDFTLPNAPDTWFAYFMFTPRGTP
jgi:hypothetical protein